jgi:hypothetical protein
MLPPLGQSDNQIAPAPHHQVRHVGSASKNGHDRPGRYVLTYGPPKPKVVLNDMAHRSMSITHLPPYPSDRPVRCSETNLDYDIMKGTPVNTDGTWYDT